LNPDEVTLAENWLILTGSPLFFVKLNLLLSKGI